MTIIAQPASTSISLTPDKRVSMFFIDMRVIYRHDTAQIILLKVVNKNVVRRLRRVWQCATYRREMMRRNLEKHNLTQGQAFNIGLEETRRVIVQHDLGAGGFGVVWKAVDPATGKEYAIKHVNAPKLLEEGKIRRDEKDLLIERIRRESRIAVPSEYVVKCYGVHEIEENFFLLNDYVPSDGNLKLWICHNAQTAWRVKKALFLKILCGVRDLHQAGIIHRDLKPQNILLTSETKIPKIIDFGLVKLEGVDLSKSGDLSGTFAYKDPSIGGKGIKYVNRTADIYALGILLYELIVGQHPWEANSIATEEFFERIRDKDNVLDIDRQFRLDAAPEEIAAVKETIRRATNFFAPEKRPQSADDMTRLLGGVPEPVRPAPPRVETPPKPSVGDQTDRRKKERRPFPARRMMTLAALLAAGALGVMYFDDGMRLWNDMKEQWRPQPQPTAMPQPTNAPTAVPSATPSPIPTATAQPSPTAQPTATPTPKPRIWPLPSADLTYTYHRTGMTAFAALRQGSVLHSGDAYKIRLTSSAEAFFYLIQVDSGGRVNRMFPNPSASNPMRMGKQYMLPSETGAFRLDNHPGTETIYVLAYPQRQEALEGDLSSLSNKQFLRLIQDAAGECSSCVDIFRIEHRK